MDKSTLPAIYNPPVGFNSVQVENTLTYSNGAAAGSVLVCQNATGTCAWIPPNDLGINGGFYTPSFSSGVDLAVTGNKIFFQDIYGVIHVAGMINTATVSTSSNQEISIVMSLPYAPDNVFGSEIQAGGTAVIQSQSGTFATLPGYVAAQGATDGVILSFYNNQNISGGAYLWFSFLYSVQN